MNGPDEPRTHLSQVATRDLLSGKPSTPPTTQVVTLFPERPSRYPSRLHSHDFMLLQAKAVYILAHWLLLCVPGLLAVSYQDALNAFAADKVLPSSASDLAKSRVDFAPETLAVAATYITVTIRHYDADRNREILEVLSQLGEKAARADLWGDYAYLYSAFLLNGPSETYVSVPSDSLDVVRTVAEVLAKPAAKMLARNAAFVYNTSTPDLAQLVSKALKHAQATGGANSRDDVNARYQLRRGSNHSL